MCEIRDLIWTYPPIERHAPVGDRRTAALIAADGTADWLCLPDYHGQPVLGSLLDRQRGGFFRMGPRRPAPGKQAYLGDTAVLITTWQDGSSALELMDAMAWPQDRRDQHLEPCRILLRRLRCLNGRGRCRLSFRPRPSFRSPDALRGEAAGARLDLDGRGLVLWSSVPLKARPEGLHADFVLDAGQAQWAVLALDADGEWSPQRAQQVLDETVQYWRHWTGKLVYLARTRPSMLRSALLIHQLSHSPSGAVVAAPTAGLPERIGGDRNYDCRLAWVRDASLAVAALAGLGFTDGAQKYMDWLLRQDPYRNGSSPRPDESDRPPFQPLYSLDGQGDVQVRTLGDLEGYRGSRPVTFGNPAAGQKQVAAMGFLADGALLYLRQHGPWRREYWEMLRDAGDYVAAHWRQPDNGIWEMPRQDHYVSSKLLSWVTLDRCIRIAERQELSLDLAHWTEQREQLRNEILDRGYSQKRQSFVQAYDSQELDAAALLAAVMGFLPGDDIRLASTVQAIESELTRDHLVYRVGAGRSPGQDQGEGAFLPCTFWLAVAHAKAGQHQRAEEILDRCRRLAGELGLFGEQVDPASGSFLGNYPMLFSQVEYVRALIELDKSQTLGTARLAAGKAIRWTQKELSSGG